MYLSKGAISALCSRNKHGALSWGVAVGKAMDHVNALCQLLVKAEMVMKDPSSTQHNWLKASR